MHLPLQTRNAVGVAFATECGRRELWLADGPTEELRASLAARRLPPAQLVLLRVALDFYDGSGGQLGLVDAAFALVAAGGREGVEGLYFLAEFLGSGLSALPESLDGWTQQYTEVAAQLRE